VRRGARAGLILAALAGIGLAAAVLHASEGAYPLPAATERLLYLRSGRTAERLMLSFDALAADVYWIRSIQSYGRDLKDRSRADRFALVQPLLDLTTTLDPHFLIAYRFGAVFLAMEPPNGPGRAEQAIALLEKGLAAEGDRWQLAYDIGFVHYFHTGDFAAAAAWFERAAGMPRAPSWLGPLAAVTKAEGGNREGARQMLRTLVDSPDAYIRRAAERSLQQLAALDALDALERLVEQYRQAHDRYPSGWSDLIEDRAIPGVPLDARGTPFVLDAVAGRVTLSPDSPLTPLPQGLRAR
jgi:tetratricopeptide (TPR) repeat protein